MAFAAVLAFIACLPGTVGILTRAGAPATLDDGGVCEVDPSSTHGGVAKLDRYKGFASHDMKMRQASVCIHRGDEQVGRMVDDILLSRTSLFRPQGNASVEVTAVKEALAMAYEAKLRFDTEEAKPTMEPPPQRYLRTASYKSAEVQDWTDGSRAKGPFKNVLLVIHCRIWEDKVKPGLPEHPRDGVHTGSDPVCIQREGLMKLYAPHFGDVFWMTGENSGCRGGPHDPHMCLVDLIHSRAQRRSGILYIHFDGLINPAHLAVGFDPTAVHSFGMPRKCELDGDLETMTQECEWGPWGHQKIAWKKAFDTGGHRVVENVHVSYQGNDDLFYIPRKAFPLYEELAGNFSAAGLHHEIAGPSIRTYLAKRLDIPHVDMGCLGDCCKSLSAEDALGEDYKCGHKFDLREQDITQAVHKILD